MKEAAASTTRAALAEKFIYSRVPSSINAHFQLRSASFRSLALAGFFEGSMLQL